MAEDDSTQTRAADREEGGTLRERLRRRVRDKTLAQELEQAAQLGFEGKDGAPLTVYMAAGLGKQRLYVIPEFGLTVVRFSANTAAGRKFSNVEFLKPILEEVKATRRLDSPQDATK
jgi:hypothetical protein